MEATFRAYPSIARFEDVVKAVQVYHPPGAPTTIAFRGTIKLHGTHGDIVATTTPAGEVAALLTQSRNRLVTPGDDNKGFAAFVLARDAAFRTIIHAALQELPHLPPLHPAYTTDDGTDQPPETEEPPGTVTLAGEYCGGNLQDDGIGLKRLPRMFVILGLKFDGAWRDMAALPTLPAAPAAGIHNILAFPTFALTVDFADPASLAAAADEVRRLTQAVEASCPFCAQLLLAGAGGAGGAEAAAGGGKGEGIVWMPTTPGLESNFRCWFKTKGEQYQPTRPPPPTAAEKAAAKAKGAAAAVVLSEEALLHIERCTLARCGQGLEYLREMVLTPGDGGVVAARHLKPFLTWMGGDVWKEEGAAALAPLGVTQGACRQLVSVHATKWWKEHVVAE